MGVPSTARRILGRAGGRTRRLIPLAPCPVEGCPIGSCTPPIPASTSNCSLRCSPNPQLPFLELRPIFRNQPIHKLLAKTAPTSLFSCHFQVQNSPRLVFRELTQIPVHGYDTTSGPFAPMSPKGRTFLPYTAWCPAPRPLRLGGRQTGGDSRTRAHARPAKRDMKEKSRQNGRRMPEEDASEFGVVRVISRPAPDAEDRLRRLFTLLLEHAAKERQAPSEKDSLPDAELAGDDIEAEA